MSRVTNGFSSAQMSLVHQVASQEDIVQACPQNFNLVSECFAAVSFDAIPSSSNGSSSINYTIFADGGLFHVDVIKHTSDYEERVLPLQWAIDSVGIKYSIHICFHLVDQAIIIGDNRAAIRNFCTYTSGVAV